RAASGSRAPLHRRRRRARPARARAAQAAERACPPLDARGRLSPAHRPHARRMNTYTLRSFEYWLIVYRRVWRGTIVSSFLNPVLYLTAMGIGLAHLVNRRTGSASL